MKLLHCADLHIDSPMKGLAAYEGAPVDRFRRSTRVAVENLVRLAIDERVAAVTIGGDVFDGTWPDVNTGLWWNLQLEQLVSEGIEVYVVHGNHDADSVITRRLSLPDRVHVFGSDRPESILSPIHPLAVHGQSYRDRHVKDDLAAGFPMAVPGRVNVGLLHTSLTGRDGHDVYAPTTESTLRTKQYDLWALGHIHKRELQVFDRTHILFPGNTQSRHAGEPGAKGVSIIETDGSKIIEVRPVEVDAVRWEVVAVDIAGHDDVEAVIAGAIDAVQVARRKAGRPLAVRVELRGTGTVWSSLQERMFGVRGDIVSQISQSHSDVWVEQVKDRTRAPRTVGAESSAVNAVRLVLERAMTDDQLALRLGAVLKPLSDNVRDQRARLQGVGRSPLTTVEVIRELLPAAAAHLISNLEAM